MNDSAISVNEPESLSTVALVHHIIIRVRYVKSHVEPLPYACRGVGAAEMTIVVVVAVGAQGGAVVRGEEAAGAGGGRVQGLPPVLEHPVHANRTLAAWKSGWMSGRG